MTGERYDRFHEFVQQSIVSERTARVKIRAKNGTIIYADNPAIVGKEIPPNEPLLKALRGETVPVLKVPEDATHAAEAQLGHLMEVVTPIIFPGTTEPQGAFALYQYYEPTAQQISGLRKWVFGTIGIGFIVLYGGLISIVWGGCNTINKQRNRLKLVNTELGISLEQLRESNGRLERSNQELEQFAHIASHDLQEPLRMVSSYTQLLERRYKDQLDTDANDFIGYAVDGARRMQTQINDLLAYSRVTTQGNRFEPTDCSGIFEKAVSNLAVAIEESGAVLTRDPLPTSMADASQLVSLFQNLIGNGIKFHGEQLPRIHVSAVECGQEWMFSFSDNGIGIEAEYAERIFGIFQRLHGKTEYPGTGIGLALCKKVVERHGGRIWVESEPGKGSTFYFTLPTEDQPGRDHDRPDHHER